MPRKQLVIQQGATFMLSFTVWDEEGGACVPRNLDGWTARMQVRSSYESPTPVLSLSTETGGIVLTPAEGRVSLFATATQTAAIAAPAAYVYDIEAQQTETGRVDRWLEGVARVTPEVTR